MNRLDLDNDMRRDTLSRISFLWYHLQSWTYGVTIRHRDSRNLVGGLCMIGVFGNFNHETSGHFIMEEAKVIIELRAGDVVFMPSAAITHRNSQLRAGESRSSIVQYTSGSLFRWVWQGKKMLSKSEMRMKANSRRAEGVGRWKELYELFPTLEELEVAKTTGLMGLGDIKQKIEGGQSLLFPRL